MVFIQKFVFNIGNKSCSRETPQPVASARIVAQIVTVTSNQENKSANYTEFCAQFYWQQQTLQGSMVLIGFIYIFFDNIYLYSIIIYIIYIFTSPNLP